MDGLCTIYENDGNEKVKIEQIKHPFGFPPIPHL